MFKLRHLAPAMARLYFDAIGVDILKWRHEIQMLGRNIFSAFRFLLNSVDWLDAEDKEKIQEKVDNIEFNPGIPSWIGDEEKIMNRIIVYNTSLDPFENEFSASQIIFDRFVNSIVSEDDEDEDEEPDPSFEVNAEYDPNTNQINMFLGKFYIISLYIIRFLFEYFRSDGAAAVQHNIPIADKIRRSG